MRKNKLTAKQQAFVDEYLKDLNATQAAIRAGYSPKTAQAIAAENLSKPLLSQAIQERMDARSKRVSIDADYVLKGIARVVDRCEQVEPVLDREGNPTGEFTFQAMPALRGYELLGRHLKLFTDKIEVSVNETLAARLAKAKKRTEK